MKRCFCPFKRCLQYRTASKMLLGEAIDRNLLNETLFDDMAYHYYKNYYYYEMDNEFVLRAAVSVVLEEKDIVIDGFELWIPIR